MYFPTLSMPFSSVTGYSQQRDFDKLVFQFSIVQSYNAEIVTLICYAMNDDGDNMNTDPIILEYDSNGAEFSFPINFGSLVLSGGELGQIDLQRPDIPANEKILILKPGKDELNYIFYDFWVNVHEERLLSLDRLNPCPPHCSQAQHPDQLS